MTDYLRGAQVAELFGVHLKTVRRWATEGKIPHIRTIGGHRRYPADQILKLKEELRG